MTNPSQNADTTQPADQYVVVARRYRPQTFDELIGQQHVAQALSNAITTNRVGHAYLFTGARGVGKTSAARIFAKALNCEHGPAAVPCNQCDICESVSSGEDIDVLEIDGASNRGIDEIRQLRQNAGVRPSRSRFKIYIIDEVHMLTREAFNALLKTLEEPPEHVKFIFCTTEPTKIPITILSRCQRFDFAGILTGSIAQRLRQIVESEGVEADDDALELLARRAAGSMRDSQSLLEQLLAFATGRITLDDVHGMLGTAGEERMEALVGRLAAREAAAAIAEFDAAVSEGVDVAQLIEQLLGYFRDCMVATAGCPAESFTYASPSGAKEVVEIGKRLGIQTILAVMQILDQTLSRMRFSTQGRILAELALVRICHLEDLDELPELIAVLQSGGGRLQPPNGTSRGTPVVKKKPESPVTPSLATSPTVQSGGTVEITSENATEIWNRALSKMSGMMVEQAKEFDHVSISAPDRLVVYFKEWYTLAKSSCERPEQVARFERALAEVAGRPVRVEFKVRQDSSDDPEPDRPPAKIVSPYQRMMEVANHPMVHRAGELFGAQPIRVDDPPKQDVTSTGRRTGGR